jgi:DNA-binding beta-propeller fold protein YncE
LLTEAAGYVLHVPPEGLDARRFETLLETGRRQLASGETAPASVTLRDALALWRGPALADLAFEPFAQSEIARLEELRLTAIENRIEADLALGRPDALVAELESLVAAHPFREGLRAQLMLALYRSGRQAEALETYRNARRTFSEELGIEPGPRLLQLEGAILRHDPSLEVPAPEPPSRGDGELSKPVRRRRFLTRWTVASVVALVLVIAAVVVAASRDSSGHAQVPVKLAGDSVAVIDPDTNAIIGEIPVRGRPTGPAVGEGSVWVGNRDDNTLLRIDPRSRKIVRTIGLGVTPTDIAVGAGSVWILSDRTLLQVDPATNHLVARRRLPQANGPGRWSHLETSANAVFVCSCTPPSNVIRLDPATSSVVTVHRIPVWELTTGEGALWAITGWELDTIERIDPRTNATVGTIPRGQIGETHGFRYSLAVGAGAIWVSSPTTLWKIDPTTKRYMGSVPLGHSAEDSSVATGEGAVWVASRDGTLLRVDPDSQSVIEIPLGRPAYLADRWDALAVGEGSVWVAITTIAS